MKPKVFVVEEKEVGEWEKLGRKALSFDEAMDLIHDLKHRLFDLRVKERVTVGVFYSIIIG